MVIYVAHLLVAIGILMPEIVKQVPIVQGETANKVYVVAALLLLVGSLVPIVIRILFDRTILKLIYQARSGILLEGRIQTRNVSLRRGTLEKILSKVPALGLRDLGSEVGEDFWREFQEQRMLVGSFFGWWTRFKQFFFVNVAPFFRKGYKTSAEREIAKIWGAYDSSAGFGLFRIEGLSSDLTGQVKIRNSFTVEGNLCPFMEGYVEGVLKEIRGANVTVRHTPAHSQEGWFTVCSFAVTS